jgi:transposase
MPRIKVVHNFLLESKVEDNQLASLKSFIDSDLDTRELKRAIAVKMAFKGENYERISQLLGVSKFFIGDWKKTFIVEGINSLKLGYKGSKKYLTPEQIAEVVKWLESRQYWHLDELINYLGNEYGVTYKSKQSYYDLFSLANISWKKSQKINPKFDEELVKKKAEEINAILAENQIAIESGEVVLFQDECHLLNGDICGYVRGKTDCRIEVPIKNEKDRQTYFGALNYQNQEMTIKGYPAGNGESTVDFVKHLQSKYCNSRIIMFWDGATYYRFGDFREYLATINDGISAKKWPVTCVLFAPNAPRQKPIEDVWLQAKNFLKCWHLCKSSTAVKILFEFFTDGQKFYFPKIHKYYPAE